MQRSLIVLLTFLSGVSLAPIDAAETMSPDIARQLGLVQVWIRPIHAPAGAQSIADQQLFVHAEAPIEYIEIVRIVSTAPEAKEPTEADAASPDANSTDVLAGDVLTRIRTGRLDRVGQPIGLAEATRLANNEIRRLKRRRIEAKINIREVPRVRLYSIASDGRIESRDAETGKIVWSKRVGDRRLPYQGLGVSEHFVTVVNGANLIQLDASTGLTIVQVPTMRAPMFGAINTGKFAMIPMIGGGIQGYPLYDPTLDPFLEIVEGSALHLPTKAPGSTRIAWGTDRGFVYVMEMQGEPSVLFRLNTDGIVSGRVASASGDRFFFASEQGQVYGVRATRSGQVMWSQPYGEPFYSEPFVIGEQVLIRSTYGNLYSVRAEDGSMMWDQPTPNVADLLGAFGDHVYVRTLAGGFAAIDRESGSRVGDFRNLRPARLLVNRMTDRLYLVNTAGHVQCLRLENAELPTFNVQPEVPVKAIEEQTTETSDSGTPFDPGGSDPFGAGMGDDSDPFGAGDDAGDDPFGGGGDMDDPFGGGADGEAMDDPFGENPFGN